MIQGAGGVRQRAGRDQQLGLGVGGCRVPLETTNSQTEAVGCCKNHIFALDLHADTGEHREGVVLTRGDGDLADGLGEEIRVDGAGHGRHVRQDRVILDGHRRKFEAGVAAADQNRGAGVLHGDFLARKCADDVGCQLTGDEDAAWLINIGIHAHAGGDFPVEARQLQAIVIREDHHTTQDRLGWLRGQRTGDPCQCRCEIILRNRETHIFLLHAELSLRSTFIALNVLQNFVFFFESQE